MLSGTARETDSGNREWSYQRHRPEETLLYQLVEEYYPRFVDQLSARGRSLPIYVQREFDEYLKCGRVEYRFLRVRCQDCHAERLVTFSCKRRGFCPSCGARQMVESAALLVDEVLPRSPMRQWALSFPFQLRFLFASRPGGAWSTSSRPSVNGSGRIWSAGDCWCGISRTLTWRWNRQTPQPWTICWVIRSATRLPSVPTPVVRHSRCRRFRHPKTEKKRGDWQRLPDFPSFGP